MERRNPKIERMLIWHSEVPPPLATTAFAGTAFAIFFAGAAAAAAAGRFSVTCVRGGAASVSDPTSSPSS